jgi:hypothetical protein
VPRFAGDSEWKTTKSVNFTVNPIFQETLHLVKLHPDDRVGFRVKDYGLLSQPTVVGLGPRFLATASVPAGCNFEGYIELEPVKQIADNGVPVLHVSVKFHHQDTSPAPAPAPAPAPGGMSDGFCLPFALQQQALHYAPYAPCAPLMSTGPPSEIVPASMASGTDSVGAALARVPALAGVPALAEVPALAGVPALVAPPAVPLSGAVSASPTSSPFAIDEAVFQLCPVNQCMDHALLMQGQRVLYPFPSGSRRNYSIVGFGFDRSKNSYHSVWKGVPADSLPENLDDVLAAFGRFAEKTDHECWCSGVPVILRLLQTWKDRRFACNARFGWSLHMPRG